jgi:hypothetical protein
MHTQPPPPHACHILILRSGHAEAPFPSSSSTASKLRCCHRPQGPELHLHVASRSAREAIGLRDRETNHTGRFILHVESTVDSHLGPSSSQVTNSPSSTRVPRSSPTSEPTTMTSVPTCHRRPSLLWLPPIPDALQTGSPTVGLRIATGPPATPLGGARLPWSLVGPPAQLVWA